VLPVSTSGRVQSKGIAGRNQWNIKKEKGVSPVFVWFSFLIKKTTFKKHPSPLFFFCIPWIFQGGGASLA